MKPVFGAIRALFPALYCGGLIYYFLDQCGGSIEEAKALGLGPTLLGLAVVGFLFCIPLIMKIVWIIATLSSSRWDGAETPDGGDGFDAEAAIARYKTRQSAEVGSSTAPNRDGSAQRASFGRKLR